MCKTKQYIDMKLFLKIYLTGVCLMYSKSSFVVLCRILMTSHENQHLQLMEVRIQYCKLRQLFPASCDYMPHADIIKRCYYKCYRLVITRLVRQELLNIKADVIRSNKSL